jgi:hypothetical protein
LHRLKPSWRRCPFSIRAKIFSIRPIFEVPIFLLLQ